MPFDPKLYDVGDIVWAGGFSEFLKVVGTTPTDEGLYVDDSAGTAWIGRLNDPPLLVRPAKWHVGDRILVKAGGAFDGEHTITKVVDDNFAQLDDQDRCILPPHAQNQNMWDIAHREGVPIYAPTPIATVPCPDCAFTDTPGVYVGFTERIPCPTCGGQAKVPG